MPWNRESPMDQRVKLIHDWLNGSYSKSQLSRRYGVSRPTVDKWLDRYATCGVDGLKERSRKPLSCPHQTRDDIIATLLAKKNEHPDRGPKQLIQRLRNTPVADGVQRALGRSARDFSDYVRRTAAMGVWANEG